MSTRIILVDDHPITLIGMRCLLAPDPQFEIVGQAQSTDGLLALLDKRPCDLLITDLMLPGSQHADGLRMIQRIRRDHPRLAIVVVTMLSNPALVKSLLDQGIRGLVSKRGLLADLPLAIRHRGKLPFLSHAFAHLLERSESRSGKALVDATRLSPREAEVLRLYGSGMAVSEIARRLCRSKQTISSQKNNAMRKLGLDTNAALYLYLQEIGLAPCA